MTMFPLCLGIYIPVSLDCICKSACVTFYNFSKLELTLNTAMWVVVVTHNCKLCAWEAEAGRSQVQGHELYLIFSKAESIYITERQEQKLGWTGYATL